MRDSNFKVFWLGFILVAIPLLVLIGLNTYLAFTSAPELKRSREAITHIFDVMTTAHSLEQTVQDAERNQRGFLITEDAAYLVAYRKTLEQEPQIFARLKQLTMDNPEQQRRLALLEQAIDKRFNELKLWADTSQREGFDAGRMMVRRHPGLDTMQTIGEMVKAVVETENSLLSQRQTRLAENERRTINTAVFGAAIALAVMLLGVIVLPLVGVRLQRSERELHASEETFRRFVEGVNDHALYMLDPEGNVTTWNAAAERIKGYGASEILGQHFSRFYTEEDRQAGIPAQTLAIALRDGKYETEAWRVKKDGSRFFASVVIDPLRDRSGRLVGFAKITRDISEKLHQQQVLEHIRQALAQSQKMEAIGQLTGGIAHDFNNFLHVIKNSIEILQRRLRNTDPDVEKFLGLAIRNTDRAANLTQRLLAFARRQPLEAIPIDPNKLVRGMAELLRQTLGAEVAIEAVLGGGVWWCLADANQLETSILNLAINARDAMPRGGKLIIETGNMYLDEAYAAGHEDLKPGQYVMIAVSDTGIGMEKKTMDQAFDPFFTTKDVGQGTGLGLSQVYGFIKQSNGHVNIYSEPGVGTTVKLYLPRIDEIGPAPWAPVFGLPDAGVTAENATILVVEDEKDVRAFTAEVLSELGYRVLLASDARDALHVLENTPGIDLLFTDVGLPNGINGRELADRAQLRWPGLKVLFTTAYTRNVVIHQGRLDRGVALIVKPFTQQDLANKIRLLLAGKNSE